ncbi:hypothetical protein ACVDG5_010865 [Mesorhizobium sp. ORM6]
MAELDGWLFSHGDYRVWVYLDDAAEATKVAIKHLPGAPTGEAKRVAGSVFRDIMGVEVGGFATGKVFR